MIAPMYFTLTPSCYKVTFQYHPMLVKCVRRIPSARYHADGKYWEVAVDYDMSQTIIDKKT